MKRFNMVFRVAACVAVAALAVYAGRRLRTHFGVRSSVAEWSAKIAKAKPAVAWKSATGPSVSWLPSCPTSSLSS